MLFYSGSALVVLSVLSSVVAHGVVTEVTGANGPSLSSP